MTLLSVVFQIVLVVLDFQVVYTVLVVLCRSSYFVFFVLCKLRKVVQVVRVVDYVSNGFRKFYFVFRLNYVYFVSGVFDVVFGCVKLSSAAKVTYFVVAWFCLFSVVSVCFMLFDRINAVERARKKKQDKIKINSSKTVVV